MTVTARQEDKMSMHNFDRVSGRIAVSDRREFLQQLAAGIIAGSGVLTASTGLVAEEKSEKKEPEAKQRKTDLELTVELMGKDPMFKAYIQTKKMKKLLKRKAIGAKYAGAVYPYVQESRLDREDDKHALFRRQLMTDSLEQPIESLKKGSKTMWNLIGIQEDDGREHFYVIATNEKAETPANLVFTFDALYDKKVAMSALSALNQKKIL